MSGSLLSPRKGLIGLVAAGLLAATALSANFAFAPPSTLHAEQSAGVAPVAGFADLAAKVMPAVVSVRVDFANVANNEDDGSEDGSQECKAVGFELSAPGHALRSRTKSAYATAPLAMNPIPTIASVRCSGEMNMFTSTAAMMRM